MKKETNGYFKASVRLQDPFLEQRSNLIFNQTRIGITLTIFVNISASMCKIKNWFKQMQQDKKCDTKNVSLIFDIYLSIIFSY